MPQLRLRTILAVALVAVLVVTDLLVLRRPAAPPPSSEELVALLPLRLPENPDAEEIGCLAMTIYHEARGEGWDGMEAVAHVVRNRALDSAYPDSICRVAKQGGETPPCQFSWWCDGRPDTPHNERLYNVAEIISYQVLMGISDDPTGGATSFHTTGVNPYWGSRLHKTAEIGTHVFYRNEE